MGPMARQTLRPARISLLLAAFVPLVAALAAWALVPLRAGAAPGEDDLRSRIEERRDREGSLAADAATFGKLERKLSRDIAIIEGRLSEVQTELDGRLALLASTRTSLQGQRRRHAGLIIRLRRSQVVLERRLVEIYQSGEPDLASFVLGAANFADLLERADFLKRVNRQDTRVIELVRSSRDEARRSAGRLKVLVGRRREAADAVQRQRDGLASMRDGLAAKRASFARARAARLAALRSARSGRRRLERELDRLLDEQAQSAVSMVGPGGPWAIPWAIVQCESGGQNFPPNWAGASGYYQIIPSTWALFGGSGPAAYLASKAEQDRVAARIWNGGAGAENWDCYKLLKGIPLG
jgi:septal ring factor EnvC (AmiA/AmiB activator)